MDRDTRIREFVFDLMRLKKESKWNGWEYHFSLEDDEKQQQYFLLIPYKDFRTDQSRERFCDMVWDIPLRRELGIHRVQSSDYIKSIVIAIPKEERVA
tara:strand:- start:14 stop:307 length:294 start_codon:yes stop_codon:yes gene_type:complete